MMDLEYCDRSTVTTKSSYETNYVNFFEDKYIPWSYEPFIINELDTLYCPDFVFVYNNQRYMLEVKGFFADLEQRNVYFNTKMRCAYEWCEKNDVVLLFSYDAYPSSIHNLIKQKVTTDDFN